MSNNAGDGTYGVSPLIQSGQIRKMVMSYIGGNKAAQSAYLGGKLAIELCPQGSIAERLRAAGSGVPGFYTRTGAGESKLDPADCVGTVVETGGIPIKFIPPSSSDTQLRVDIPGTAKEVRHFDDRRFIFEPAITGDVAILRAWKVDKAGNCRFRYTTRSFGGLCARAAALTIVEAEEIVEVGEIEPMDIDLPGIYVDRIVQAKAKKRIEHVTVQQPVQESTSQNPGTARRERIARRAAKELKNGSYCNLGIGMPTLAANYLPEGTKVWFQSENGILGMGPFPAADRVDA